MKRVLILDDRPINRQFLTTLLAYKGFQTREAADGAQGLEVARQWPPDLAIVDIAMPGMDGVEFVRRLRADPALGHTPVIFYTASYELNEAQQMARDCGVDRVLMKPSDPEVVLRTIDEVLGRSSPPATSASAEVTRLQSDAMRTSALIDFHLEVAGQRSRPDILKILARAARNILDSAHSVVTVDEQSYIGCDDGCDGYGIGNRAPSLRVALDTANKRHGWLTLTEKRGGGPYGADDERIALTIAAQAAIAYENLGLYEELRSEAELLDRNVSLLHATIEASHDGILVVDLDSHFVTFNRRFVEIWRVPDEILATSDSQRSGQHALAQLKDPVAFLNMNQFAVAGEDVGGTYETTDGRFIECQVAPRRLDQQVLGRVWTFRDVTERVRAETELNRVARERELLLQSTGDGIFAIDLNGTCTMANHVAAQLLGRTAEDLIGRRIHDLIQPDGPQFLVTQAERVADATFLRRDGTKFPVEFIASPIIDEGVLRGAVVSFTDITERRRMEQRLEQVNRIDSLGRMAATLAHEFNNVLMGIQPFAEVVRRVAGENQMLARAAGQILNSVARGKTITNDILRMAHVAEPAVTSVEVAKWLDQLAPELSALAGARVRFDCHVISAAELFACFDPAQMQQVITNLVVNARDAMNGAGTLQISASRQDEWVRISVADSGSGIDAETLPLIFEPLFTTKRQGTGLGLAVAQQLVVHNGGTIGVESTVGEGTRFQIDLPAVKSAGDDETADASTGARSMVERVLIVDDDAAVAAGLTAILESDGVDTRVITRGAEAVSAVAEFDPDAVIIDITLPDITGAEVYDRIAERSPGMAVIFSTGRADEAALPAPQGEHVGFLRKPYSGETLLGMLRDVVSVRRLRLGLPTITHHDSRRGSNRLRDEQHRREGVQEPEAPPDWIDPGKAADRDR